MSYQRRTIIVRAAAALGALMLPERVRAAKKPPHNITPPQIVGSTVVSSTLTVTPGVWRGATGSPTYQWQRGSGSSWADIGGATGQQYVLQTSDVGLMVRVRETVDGVNAFSAPVGPVTTVQNPDLLTWAPPGYPSYSGYTHITLNDTGTLAPGFMYGGSSYTMRLNDTTDYVLHLGHRQVAAGAGAAGIEIVGGRNIVMIGGQITGPMQANVNDYSESGSAFNEYALNFTQNQGTVHIEGVLIDGFFETPLRCAMNIPAFGGSAPHGTIQIQNCRAMCTMMWKENVANPHSNLMKLVSELDASHLAVRLDKFTGSYDQTGFALFPSAGSGGRNLTAFTAKRTNLRAQSLFGTGAGQCSATGHPGPYGSDYICQFQPTIVTLDQFWTTLGYERAGAGTGDCPPQESTTRALVNEYFLVSEPTGADIAFAYSMTGNPSPGPSVQGDTLTFTNPSSSHVYGPDGVSGGVVHCGVPPGGDFAPAGTPGIGIAGVGYQSPGYL